jgi:hypothetical protein
MKELPMRRVLLLCSLVLPSCYLDRHPELAEPLELCNGVDDDGDPATLDGSAEPTLGDPCDGADADHCATGAIACIQGQLVCADDHDERDDTEVCNGLDDDCDGEVDEGFDLSTDPGNCGFCGHACSNANGTNACAAGVCVPTCVSGSIDCNGDPGDGCEVFRDRDPTCSAAATMGSVAGDLGAESVELTGTDEAFFEVAVLEQSTLVTPVTATIVLDNPPGVNFDLFVTCGACDDAIMASSTSAAGLADRVVFRHEDTDFANDSQTLHIEVRFVSATTCGAAWHLQVTGATPVATTTCGP